MSLIAHQARTIVKKLVHLELPLIGSGVPRHMNISIYSRFNSRQIKEAQETQEAAEKAVETCDEAYKLSLQVKEKQVNAR